ncbi:LysE family translocator [Vogesella sp. GCM10023246]|uniref:LysE family transporter n=1 Tax=Vogesella oryzagri TaxID=3160864 RepID=A0ABV1M7W5_9NEIS
MLELLAVATITILAVISPGADFAMITRYSLLHGRRDGLLAALGIALGVLLHVLYTLLGVGLLLAASPLWLNLLKWLGAAYLVYIGIQTFRSPPLPAQPTAAANLSSRSRWQALRSGLLCNALNPKTTLFVVSTFSQLVSASTPLWQQAAYGLFMSAAHLLWFALVALCLSSASLRARLLQRQQQLNRVIGAILATLGGVLAASSVV